MTSLPILAELPAGFRVVRDERGVCARRVELEREFEERGFGLDAARELPRSDLFGRTELRELTAAGARFVVRRFHHGGLLRWLTGARFRDPERPFRELVLAARLAELGFRTPEVVAARALTGGAGAWFLDVVTRRVEGSRDLGRVLAADARGELDVAPRRRLYAAAGALVRRLHGVGFVHADLTPRNLLVVDAAPDAEPWVLDLDRSTFVDGLDVERRTDNLRRLHRHVARLVLEGRAVARRTDLARFARAYAPERGERRALVRAIQTGQRRSRGLHSTGWFLERHLGGRGSDAR
ncbi:MAG: lipopolysaccharide kinase InaA family protein [Planctomycetes bacterium]|nr:lipopolysaccharide kinase InaA family protein [Planctomycetota bacterium]